MKICLFTHTIPRYFGDPSAPFMDVLANALVEVGHKVTVLAPFDEKVDTSYKRKYKLVTFKYVFPISLHILGYSRSLKGDRSLGFLTYLISPFFYFFGLLTLLKLTKTEKFDVISSHWIIPNGFIASLVSKITKVPFTATIPGSDVYLGGKNFFFKWMTGFASKNASYVISDSSHYLKQLNDLGFYPKKTEVIRYGVDMTKLKPQKSDNKIKSSLGIDESESVILGVGRMVSKKGFIYLVKSLPGIIDKIPNIKLVLVGDGEERKRLEELSKELGVHKNIVFPGMVAYDQLSKYYNLADIFVMPSIKDEKGNIDASPVSMMEAMAVGVPVITTRFGGSEDLIIDGVTGYLVKEKNSGEIEKAVLKFLDSNKIGGLKRKVREIALQNFSSIEVAKRYTKCFEDSIL